MTCTCPQLQLDCVHCINIRNCGSCSHINPLPTALPTGLCCLLAAPTTLEWLANYCPRLVALTLGTVDCGEEAVSWEWDAETEVREQGEAGGHDQR